MTDDAAVPAALVLPYGHLFMGYPLVPRPANATSDLGDVDPTATAPTFQGQGATLSGRMRPNQQAAAAAAATSPKKEEASPSVFKGQGNSLGKKREVIEID
jgi:ubiquitin fusion degradation protein 1